MQGMYESNISDLPLLTRGKVRDIYDLGDELLVVATDRISCFDVVVPTPIFGKGRVLTEMSVFWFRHTGHIIGNHFETTDLSDVSARSDHLRDVRGSAMVVKKAVPIPIVAGVRGYLAGSAWTEYERDRTVCGIEMPFGLRRCGKLHDPIFTPAAKAEQGDHHENILFSRMQKIVGNDTAAEIRRISMELYKCAASYAAKRGIIIADTKFEFGYDKSNNIVLIDEVLTPDSSRFWPVDEYEHGRNQASFDKQYVRDYLESVGFNRTPPAPELPDAVVRRTTKKYMDALIRIVR
jgi:phosphoribosylaminoimidazole-succinocarboxamide synthase